MPLDLIPARTALVLIDLQMGTLALPLQPHDAATVTANGLRLARATAAAGGLVVRVRVDFGPGAIFRPQGLTDAPMAIPPGGPPPEYSMLHPDVAALPDALDVVKRQWGAFHGTDLDDRLRRRGIDTIILGGIATNFGVEQTAREAWAHNYSVVVAAEACTTMSPEMQDFALTRTLPRVSRVRGVDEVVGALG